jgi:hypothetical protein
MKLIDVDRYGQIYQRLTFKDFPLELYERFSRLMFSHALMSEIPIEEMEFTASLVMGERTVEIPGRYIPLEAPSRP